MDYCEGKAGRVFVLRLGDGEAIYDAIEGVCQREGVRSATIQAVGGIRSSRIVTGPETVTLEIDPHYEEFDDARELVGVGTIFMCEGKPTLHFHAGVGRGREALVGCPRGGAKVFLVMEVVIQELLDVDAERRLDPVSKAHLLAIGPDE